MADPVPLSPEAAALAGMVHVDFEVIAVIDRALLVRFRVNDKHIDRTLQWDGQADVIEFIKQFAYNAALVMRSPPPPTFEKLQEQVGKQGHIDVPISLQV